MIKILTPLLTLLAVFHVSRAPAQETFPENGIPDKRNITYALVHAHLTIEAGTAIEEGMLLIRDGRVVYAGKAAPVPVDAVVVDMKGRYLYPSFVDLSTGYGLPEPEKRPRERRREPQFLSGTRGAYSWNEALRPEQDAASDFDVDTAAAKKFREAGFGTVMTHHRDGIARGTAAVVTLGERRPHEEMVKRRAVACFSFDKGTSQQDYPGSQMGVIALLRQTFLDARWYADAKPARAFNRSLEAWNANSTLTPWFEAGDKLSMLRAAAIGKEFGVSYIMRGGGDSYQRAAEIKAAGMPVVVPVNFPDPFDVSDPDEALNVSLRDMMHWEHAPSNAAVLSRAGVRIAFTADGLEDKKDFLKQVRKAASYGLDERAALDALTGYPARLAGVDDQVGSLQKGRLANILVTSGPLFDEDAVVLENWVRGNRYEIRTTPPADLRGKYRLVIGAKPPLALDIGGTAANPKATVRADTLKAEARLTYEEDRYLLRFELKSGDREGAYRLSGYRVDDNSGALKGRGFGPDGTPVDWHTEFDSAFVPEPDTGSVNEDTPEPGPLLYPLGAYGFREPPPARTVLFRNATVWTGEDAGILEETDVLVRNGKIAAIGKNLDAAKEQVETVDGTGLHLTAGIIDEHSHIAVSGPVNECTQAVTAEVRIGDVVDCDDIQIYRQLAGGVTSSHLLHGSCNPVGGQSQLIKLRWGRAPEEMKFKGWPGFIKFALGENVKQSNWGDHQQTRYPQTRMGVEQVYMDAFTRAREYKKAMQSKTGVKPRRDLELDALAEILDGRRFITCHSYRQNEINMLMHVADSFGFTVNTFTHILEGYKVADKMKAHGAGGSTFSDWWAYKFEVYEAIPYNGALMHDAGVVVAFNSDDPEMARRLNQEAAKAVRYGGVSEAEAWKFVTLNPARLLHVDDRVGSIRVGKDADLVLWSGHPLSVYAKALQTYVDGIRYYDEAADEEHRKFIESERARLIARMIEEGKKGKTQKADKEKMIIKHCIDEEAVY